MCMKPCANTKQICSWQLWAYASKFPSLGKAFHFLVTISKLTPVLHIRAITSKDRGVIPQMCANLNRGYREGSGSNPPPSALSLASAVPGGCAGRQGAPRSSAALLCPPPTRHRHGERRDEAAFGWQWWGCHGELSPGKVSVHTACFLGAAREGDGRRTDPRGETDAKMIKMCHSNFFDEKVLVSADFFKKHFPKVWQPWKKKKKRE